jgi:molybdenum cofactor synthesis domain-containing protein
VVEVREIRKPKAGVVITGNEVYYGRIKDAFAPVIQRKIAEYGGEINGIFYAPDDAPSIAARLRELINAGCDLLITTGGMSVDPDDVTRFAIRNLGTRDLVYGSPVLPGSMFLVAYLEKVARGQGAEVPSERNGHSREPLNPGTLEPLIPILGIPACGIYSKTTVFDLLLPRILAGDIITREEIAELGHGGLCLNCNECRYPLCPFGK